MILNSKMDPGSPKFILSSNVIKKLESSTNFTILGSNMHNILSRKKLPHADVVTKFYR